MHAKRLTSKTKLYEGVTQLLFLLFSADFNVLICVGLLKGPTWTSILFFCPEDRSLPFLSVEREEDTLSL